MTEAKPPRRRLASLTGLVLALVVPALLTAAPGALGDLGLNPTTEVIINEAAVWALALAVLAIVRFWERRPLTSIGLGKPTWNSLLTGGCVTLGLLFLAGMAAFALETSGLPMPENQTDLILGLPLWLQLLVAFSAGVTEEILFRGYAIERMTELTRSRWLGAIVPVLVFGGVHAPFWGIAHAIVAGFSGLWLTLLYLWRRNLWTNIAAHALLDGLVFIAIDLAQKFGMT